MTPQNPEYDPDYREFIKLFNQEKFEASHQALLPAWQQNITYDFYKALIQLAGAFQHCRGGNAFWAEDLFASAHNLLEKYAPAHEGMDVDRLLQEIRRCNEIARRAKESGEPEKNLEKIPGIELKLDA